MYFFKYLKKLNVFYRFKVKHTQYSLTMSNRINYFIRSILQNSKLNREKFVNNKKIYNEYIAKRKQNNSNRIITRKISTFVPPLSFGSTGGGGGGPKKPNWNDLLAMAAVAIGATMGIKISSYPFNKK